MISGGWGGSQATPSCSIGSPAHFATRAGRSKDCMDSMDCVDASPLTPARNSSVTAVQALSMLNNHFMVRYSEHLAKRLASSKVDRAGQIELAFQLAYNRRATREEIEMLGAYGAN